MKKVLIVLVIQFIAAMMIASAQNKSGSVAFTVHEKDLIPEGITYDPVTRLFFLSSINKEKILAVSENGDAKDFAGSGEDGLMETLGMKVDDKRRRLWVVSNRVEGGVHISAVHIFNLDTKTLIRKYTLKKDSLQLFNDIVLTKGGGAFITDTYSGWLYAVTGDMGDLQPFFRSDSLLQYSNGLALSPDDKYLYVATHGFITLINLKTGESGMLNKPADVSTSGIDGLVFYRNSLIGVVNNKTEDSEMYVAQFTLNRRGDQIVKMKVIDRGNPQFNLPTTCVVADDYLYCLANTSLRIFLNDRTGSLDGVQEPVVLKYKLSE